MNLTPSLEDYLETTYLLCTQTGVARVRDIANARNVKAGSVGTALVRLAELGLIVYERHGYITITEEGKVAARKIYSRHQILFQFFHQILGMEQNAAQQQACDLEHALSDDAMERFARFFEQLLTNEHSSCLRVSDPPPANPHDEASTNLVDLPIGATARIKQVLHTQNGARQRLLDMGILPNVEITKERTALGGDPIWIKVDDTQLALRKAEARAVIVFDESTAKH